MTFFMHLKRPCGCIVREEIKVKDEAEGRAIFERMAAQHCDECVEKKMIAFMIHRESAEC